MNHKIIILQNINFHNEKGFYTCKKLGFDCKKMLQFKQ